MGDSLDYSESIPSPSIRIDTVMILMILKMRSIKYRLAHHNTMFECIQTVNQYMHSLSNDTYDIHNALYKCDFKRVTIGCRCE